MSFENLVVTALAPSRHRVDWNDDSAAYYFIATFEDNKLVKIQQSSIRNFPTIYVILNRHAASKTTTYYNADAPDMAETLADITQQIYLGSLASKATQAAEKERAIREAELVRTKAALVHKLLLEHAGHGLNNSTDPEGLAAFYDAIQNSAL